MSRPKRFTPMKTNQMQHWPPDGAGRHRLHVHEGDLVAAAEDGRLVVRQRGDGAAAVRRLEDVRGDGKDCRATRRTTTSLQAFPAGVCVCMCVSEGGGAYVSWPGGRPARRSGRRSRGSPSRRRPGWQSPADTTKHNTTQQG